MALLINDNIKLFSKEVEGFLIREMERKVIPQTLKPQARLKYVDKGGNQLREQEDIFELCRTISDELSIKYEIQQHNNKSQNSNAGGNSTRNQRSSEDRKKKDTSHAANMMEHTNGKTAPTIGATKAMPPTPMVNPVPTQCHPHL